MRIAATFLVHVAVKYGVCGGMITVRVDSGPVLSRRCQRMSKKRERPWALRPAAWQKHTSNIRLGSLSLKPSMCTMLGTAVIADTGGRDVLPPPPTQASVGNQRRQHRLEEPNRPLQRSPPWQTA